jgi:hypothetical protein
MGTAPLVDEQIEDGRKLINQLVCDGFDVSVAFWIRFELEGDGPWFYIASRTVDKEGLHAVYRAVHESIRRIAPPWGPWISVSDVGELKLVGLSDRFARDVMALSERYADRHRFRRVNVGNQLAEELYVYPRVEKSAGVEDGCRGPTITIGEGAATELIDLGKARLVTIIRDPDGGSKVVLLGGGKAARTLEGDEAQQFTNQLDVLTQQMQ